MTTKINKRSIAPPTNPANQKSVADLKTAVDELSGSVGQNAQRAVRLCELIDAGILKLTPEGLVEIGANAATNTFNSVLTVRPQGGPSEGGEISLLGAPGYTTARIDSYQSTTRLFGGASNPLTWNRQDGELNNPGIIRATGSGAALFTHDRTSARTWALYGTSDTFYLFNGTNNILVSDNVGNFYSGFDNARSCGAAGNRWSVVYAGTGTISTSDARDKTPVRTLEQAELQAAVALAREIGVYQWLAMVASKGAEHARLHCGMTVQRAIEVMQSFGLDPMRYGFICYDSWPEVEELVEEHPAIPATYSETGVMLSPEVPARREVVRFARAAGESFSFRMEQLLLFLAAGFEARLTALENPDGPSS